MAKKPAAKDIVKPKLTKVAERDARALRAGGQSKLVNVAEASASAVNTDRRIVMHEGSAAETAIAKMRLLRHSQSIAGKGAGFVSH